MFDLIEAAEQYPAFLPRRTRAIILGRDQSVVASSDALARRVQDRVRVRSGYRWRPDMSAEDIGSLLLVDDDTVLSAALERGFAARGFHVQMAHTFAEASELIEACQFQYAVVDVRLPGGQGLELVPRLKAASPGTNVVVLTGYGSIPSAVESIKLGATYYLAKPVRLDDILNAFAHEASRAETPRTARPMSLRRLEWEHINRVLRENDGNVSAAARALSMHRRTLQRKLAKRPARD